MKGFHTPGERFFRDFLRLSSSKRRGSTKVKDRPRKLGWVFAIVNGFPESHPQVEHSQAAGESAHKSIGNEAPQRRGGEQQGIVRPLVGPGQDDQQNPEGCAHGDKQQGPNPQ